MSKKIFYLTGFMASGKSTIGPILANTLGWAFFDIDKEIEKSEKKKITQIFASKGEDYFRQQESKILKKLSKGKYLIVSLGGGTLKSLENRKVINETGKLIYLRSSADVSYRRLKFKKDRPFLLTENDEQPSEELMMEKIEKLLKERKKYYEKADYIFDTDYDLIGITVDKIAKTIQKAISKL